MSNWIAKTINKLIDVVLTPKWFEQSDEGRAGSVHILRAAKRYYIVQEESVGSWSWVLCDDLGTPLDLSGHPFRSVEDAKRNAEEHFTRDQGS